MEARVGPMPRIPIRKRSAGTLHEAAGPGDACPQEGREGPGIADGEQGDVAGARRHGQGQEPDRRAAHDPERGLLGRDRPEAAPPQQDVEGLHRGREEGQPEPERVQVAADPAAEHHDRHPGQGQGEGRRARAGEPFLAEDDRRPGDEGRVRVEAEERDGDARPLEGREDSQVEDEARSRGEHEGGDGPRRQGEPADPVPTARVKVHEERAQRDGTDGGPPEGEGERREAGVVGGPRRRAERSEQARRDGDRGRPPDGAPGGAQGTESTGPTAEAGGPGSGLRWRSTTRVKGTRSSAKASTLTRKPTNRKITARNLPR